MEIWYGNLQIFFPPSKTLWRTERNLTSTLIYLHFTEWKDEIRESQINPQTAQRQRAFLGAALRAFVENAELQYIWKVNMQ